MNSKLYKHKKTEKLYSLVQKNINVKGAVIFLANNEVVLDWEDKFVLYKAEYDNPEGPYFVRYSKDFYENFEEVENETNY